MSGSRDIGRVADLLITQLVSDMPTRLDTLDAEYSDHIELEDIPDANYFVSERAKMPSFPMCCVIPDWTDAVPFDGQSRYDIEYHYLTIAVAVSLPESEDDLTRRTLRTTRAVEEVFLNARTLGGSVDDVMILRKDYSPLISGSNALMREGQIHIRVQTRPDS